MTLNLKYDFMKLIRILLALLLSAMLFSAFSQAPGNFSTLRVTTLNGNMKANGTSLVTADTLLLKADTLRADAELFVRDSTLLEIIQANASSSSFGTDNQVPYTNAAGNNFDYSSNFTFDGDSLTINGKLKIDNISIDNNIISSIPTNGNIIIRANGTGNQTLGSVATRQ